MKRFLWLVFSCAAFGGDWSAPADIYHDTEKCVSYRARLAGDTLVIDAQHSKGWHSNSMDNKIRAEEKLAGRQSLGTDRPTEIKVSGGLEVVGKWHQTPPRDASQPDLLWFTWVFEDRAVFAAKVRRTTATAAQIAIRAQACTASVCKNIEASITLPLPANAEPADADADWKTLIPVR